MTGRLPGLRRVEHLMGMVIGVDVRDDLEAGALGAMVGEVFEWLDWVEATFSTYRDDSAVSRLAAGKVTLADCPPEVGEVLARCEELRVATDGFFDVQAGGRLDPAGLVKGWSVERASALLVARGAANHSINAGGDVRTRGAPEPGRPWTVGVAHPLQRDALCAVIAVGPGAVATSGIAERGAHVVNPRTGTAALELASVTVVSLDGGPGGRAADLGTTDAYATAALARGLDAPAWLGTLEGYESYVVDAGGFAWQSDGFARLAVPQPA